jgi:hypothetical protein
LVKKHTDRETAVRLGCLNKLDWWRRLGYVVDFDDVSALGKRQIRGRWVMKTEKGKRDIIALIKVKNICWVYLIECKAPAGGNWNKEQQEYAQKFAWLDNVIYEVVTNPSQVDTTIAELTGHTPEKLMKL